MTDEDFARWLMQLAEDGRHGASELARRCLGAAAAKALHPPAGEAVALRALLAERAAAMAAARPTMAPIDNLLARWRGAVQDVAPEAGLERRRAAAPAAARALVEESRDAVGRAAAGRHRAPVLGRAWRWHRLLEARRHPSIEALTHAEGCTTPTSASCSG